MRFAHSVRTIYAKELVDILRDRRTLIAMVLVPIVLYPLLMLGSVQALSYTVRELRSERFIIGVLNERDKASIEALIRADGVSLANREAELDPDLEDFAELPRPLNDDVKVVAYASIEALTGKIQDRAVQVGVVFPDGLLVPSPGVRNPIELHADYGEVRSANAARRIDAMIARVAEATVRNRLKAEGLPESFVTPYDVVTVDLSTESSVLGEILPLILVLMTITGAIYPAIDLTAGERERGTLESLMVCPVPVLDLIVGKFLVVTTVAIMGATLNLTSVTATVYFGGFSEMISSEGGSIPIGRMLLILVCLVPFAIFMSAIMMAVCSFARTFKEAQNYVTPVIIAVLIPGGIAALPTSELAGTMLVMPVGNMVLLSRELLLGAHIPFSSLVFVLASTTIYAAAAVAVAVKVFGQESVVFADSGSLKMMLSRRLIKPSRCVPMSMALTIVAVLFPVWFYTQTALAPGEGESAAGSIYGTAMFMPIFFALVPIALLAYGRINLTCGFALRRPPIRYVVAAVLIGISAWVPAFELNALQQPLFGGIAVDAQSKMIGEALIEIGPWMAFLAIAIVPAVCEELFFRGLLLGSLCGATGKWTAIIVSACVFGVFHFFLAKFLVTAVLGVVLAYLCVRSRSILPGMIAHVLNNGLGVLFILYPGAATMIGISDDETLAHLPLHVLVIGGGLFAAGLLATSVRRVSVDGTATDTMPAHANAR
ncbi:MAG: CPBP family intramembrane metalloprotease [Planctomycetes bacterium]|nr:CPBP family intramembrane metalloprotease [Planctomycetota bacterium]